MTQLEYAPTFREVASDLTLLDYNPDFPDENGRFPIGTIECDDGCVVSWTVVFVEPGYALEIEIVAEGIDANGEYITPEDESKAYLLPIQAPDSNSVFDRETLNMPCIPATFPSAAQAYDAFLDVVYTTERTESFAKIADEARKIVGAYIDAEKAPFDQFKEALFNAAHWAKHDKKWHLSLLANAMLCLRYPFLIPWPNSAENSPWECGESVEMFSYTHFDSIPAGWAKRFGLELCEDIRNQNFDEDNRVWTYRNCESCIHQIKEKFGALRIYMDCFGKGQDILEAYEFISENVCIECGKADKTRITHGYVLPLCWDEVCTDHKERNRIELAARKRFLSKRELEAPWNERDWNTILKIQEYAMFEAACISTSPASTSAKMRKMTEEWIWTAYSKNGTEYVNKAIGLLDGTPAPNGEPIWARAVALSVADDIAELEKWLASGCIAEQGSLQEFANEHSIDFPEWFNEHDNNQ